MPKSPKTWQELPLVEVIWTDAAIDVDHEGQVHDADSIKKFGGLARCRDIGYLIRKNRTEVVLASGLIPDEGGFRHSNTFPRNWVSQIIPLSRPNDLLHHPDVGPPEPPDAG